MLIHELLKLWRSIPAEDINKGLQAVDDVSLMILKSLRMKNMEWLDAIIALASPTAFASVKLLAFMREITIGYIEHMRSLDAKTRVKSMERFLYSHTQVDYYVGIFEGIGEGLIDWFKDLWGMFEGMYELIAKLPEYIEQIRKVSGEMAEMVINLIQFLNDPSSGSTIEDMLKNFDPLDIFTWIDAGIEKAGQKAGALIAEKVIRFMNLTPIEAGRKIGWLIGYIIPEVILAVFSFGIGTAVKAGAQVFARAMNLIFRILSKTLKLVIDTIKIVVRALDKVIDFVKSIAQFFKKAGKKISKFFDKLEEFFQKFKEYLKRKEKTPDADDLLPEDKDKLPEKHDKKTSDPDLTPDDKENLPEKEEKKSGDVDESKESDKLEESSLDEVDNIEVLNEIDRIKGLSKEERINELGLDPIKNKVDVYEGEIGQFAESSYGYFKRYTASAEGDFISMSGPYKGKVFDAFGVPQHVATHHTFADMSRFFPSIKKHFLNKPNVDYLILDMRYMNHTQKAIVKNHLKENFSEHLNRLIILD